MKFSKNEHVWDGDLCQLSTLPSLFNSLVSELLSESESKSTPSGNEPISPCALETIVRVYHKTITRHQAFLVCFFLSRAFDLWLTLYLDSLRFPPIIDPSKYWAFRLFWKYRHILKLSSSSVKDFHLESWIKWLLEWFWVFHCRTKCDSPSLSRYMLRLSFSWTRELWYCLDLWCQGLYTPCFGNVTWHEQPQW